MGTSTLEGKEWIKNQVSKIFDISKIIDVGAGQGTYRQLLSFIPCKWCAIEAHKEYIRQFNLMLDYDLVINKDVREIDVCRFIHPIDLTIFGDVLEHMTKDEAIRVFKDFAAISRYVLISIPIIKYPQGEINNNPYEVHIKDDWTHDEALETFGPVQDFFKGDIVGCYLIRGNQE